MRISLSSLTLVALAIGLATFGAQRASAGGGCHAEGLTDAAATEVRLAANCFEPSVVRIAVGDTITWVNEDATAHTVTGVRGSFGTYDELMKGDEVTNTFDDEGVFPYFCVLHPSMVGAVVVGDGEAGSGDTAIGPAKPASDDGGMNSGEVAGIAAAAIAGTVALGLVTTRVVRRRRAA